MHVALGGQPGAYVDELADALSGQVPHCAAQEPAVLPARGDPIRDEPHERFGCRPVGFEVVFPAEQVVIDPGHVRDPRAGERDRQVPAGRYHGSSSRQVLPGRLREMGGKPPAPVALFV